MGARHFTTAAIWLLAVLVISILAAAVPSLAAEGEIPADSNPGLAIRWALAATAGVAAAGAAIWVYFRSTR